MILFKSCPRCGGDVDTTFADDVFCVQCGHRPATVFPGPRIADGPKPGPATPAPKYNHLDSSGEVGPARPLDRPAGEKACPRCGSERVIGLTKLRAQDNTCYRCRICGHIFSPGIQRACDSSGTAFT